MIKAAHDRRGRQTFKIITRTIKKILSLQGHTKNIILQVPLDSKNEYSRALAMSFSANCYYNSSTVQVDLIHSITKDILLSEIKETTEDGVSTISNIKIYMINRHLLE